MTVATRRKAKSIETHRNDPPALTCVETFGYLGFACKYGRDRETRDWLMEVDGQPIGYAVSGSAADTTIREHCDTVLADTRATTADMAAETAEQAEIERTETPTRTVTIPSCDQHGGHGFNVVTLTLQWTCPTCDGPRGEPYLTRSYDGSCCLQGIHGWRNPCGHVDYYGDVREEARRQVAPSPTWTDDKIAAGLAPDASDDDRSLALALSNLRARAQNECPCGSSCPCCDPSHPDAIEQRIEREKAENTDPDLDSAPSPTRTVSELQEELERVTDAIHDRKAVGAGYARLHQQRSRIIAELDAAHKVEDAALRQRLWEIITPDVPPYAPPYAGLGDDREKAMRDDADAEHAADETALDQARREPPICRACEQADCAGVYDIQRCGSIRSQLLAPGNAKQSAWLAGEISLSEAIVPYDKGAGTGESPAITVSVPVDDPCAGVRAELAEAIRVLKLRDEAIRKYRRALERIADMTLKSDAALDNQMQEIARAALGE